MLKSLANLDDTSYISYSDNSQHSTQSSPIQKIKHGKQPLNCFKIQIIIKQSDVNPTQVSSQNNSRHTLSFNTQTELLDIVKNVIRPKVVNALQIYDQLLFYVEDDIFNTFPTVFIVLTYNTVHDITEIEQQKQIINDRDRREHRNFKNNAQEISLK